MLLAEDDEQTRKYVLRVLTEAGFEVLVAQDGAEALSLAVNLERAPDIIVSDVMMPGMSGVELFERVRRHHPKLPILFTSGYTDDVLDENQFDLANDLLQKPFGREELLARVVQKLEEHLSSGEIRRLDAPTPKPFPVESKP